MNLDLILLKMFLSKTIFNKYKKILNLDFYKANNKELFKLFLTLFKLHDEKSETDEDSLTLDNLAMFFYTLYPNIKADEKSFIDNILTKVETLEVDEKLAFDYLKTHHQQTVATEIAIKALEVSQGRADITVLQELYNSAVDLQEEVPDDLFVSTDLEILLEEISATQGLRWRLNTMNKTLGSLRIGDFGFLFARPETGKTTFLASEVTHMAEQAKEHGYGAVLWLNNEEGGGKVMLRCYQALFGVALQELYTNLPYYKEEFEKRIGTHFKLYDSAKISKQDVEKLCQELKPSLIIIDQIDKIYWAESERYDLKMKAIYQWARELAKQYAPVIAICQAGGTAEGKKYLNMNDVDSSHTAKQGEADFMIGLGKTNTDGEEHLRFISICKNKLMGDADTLADLRHAKLPIIIEPTVARYVDSVELN